MFRWMCGFTLKEKIQGLENNWDQTSKYVDCQGQIMMDMLNIKMMQMCSGDGWVKEIEATTQRRCLETCHEYLHYLLFHLCQLYLSGL